MQARFDYDHTDVADLRETSSGAESRESSVLGSPESSSGTSRRY